jgi:hypothetical protein
VVRKANLLVVNASMVNLVDFSGGSTDTATRGAAITVLSGGALGILRARIYDQRSIEIQGGRLEATDLATSNTMTGSDYGDGDGSGIVNHGGTLVLQRAALSGTANNGIVAFDRGSSNLADVSIDGARVSGIYANFGMLSVSRAKISNSGDLGLALHLTVSATVSDLEILGTKGGGRSGPESGSGMLLDGTSSLVASSFAVHDNAAVGLSVRNGGRGMLATANFTDGEVRANAVGVRVNRADFSPNQSLVRVVILGNKTNFELSN